MKKIVITLLFAAATAVCASAEGYQVNALSAKQTGMGHTGVALKLGAESQIFNPAALSWFDKTIEVDGCVSPLFSYITAKPLDANGQPTGQKFETDNKAATPMSFNAAFSIYDNFKAGVSFYTPYGSGVNWTDNWPGAALNQSVSLKVFTVQPTLSWRITPKLGVGAGLMISWGQVDLNKALVSAESFDLVMSMLDPTAPSMGNTAPASVNLKGNAHPRLGVNVGVMYDINDKVTLGFNYRSEMKMEVKAGDAQVRYANQTSQAVLDKYLGMLHQSQFTASMPCPALYTLGVSYKPIKPLVLTLDVQMTGWKTYKALDIEFLDQQLGGYNQHIVKDYHNSWSFRLGAQYALTDRFDLRAGLMIDTPPCDKNHYNPETPAMAKIEPTVGFSFRPVENVSIDLGFLYAAGLGAKDRSCTYPDFLAKVVPGMSPEKTFRADYSVYAFNPSIGVSFKF